jgi:hypothetical protein
VEEDQHVICILDYGALEILNEGWRSTVGAVSSVIIWCSRSATMMKR